MLYSFSKSYYSRDDLIDILNSVTKDDALLFWMDGVLLPIKYPDLFQKIICTQQVLKRDLDARNIENILLQKSPQITSISINDCVFLTTQYFPQISY